MNRPARRLLVGGDFHLGPLCHEFERRLVEKVVPIFCGDLVNRPREDAAVFSALVDRWQTRNADLVVVPGNHDPEDTGHWEGVQVHERHGLCILAVPIIPILYKIPTWTHEYAESRIAEMLAPYRGGAYDVVASHGPPHGVCDRVAWGRRIGSRALRDFASEITFQTWVCGHVHEERGNVGEISGRPLHNVAGTILDLDVEVPRHVASNPGTLPR